MSAAPAKDDNHVPHADQRDADDWDPDDWDPFEALSPYNDELLDRIERLQRRLWLERAGLISLALVLGWAGVGSV